MRLSVIIPVYNEGLFIEEVIRKVKSVVLPIGITKEIIIINDCSTDKTEEILRKYANDPQLKIYRHNVNMGKSEAVKLGIQKATGDILIIQDADLEYDPVYYPLLIEPLAERSEYVVYGSRFKGHIKRMNFINRIANLISNITVNILFNVKVSDINTGYKAFRKEVFESISLTSNGFTFETEITARLLKAGYRIFEVPIGYTARSKKEGKKIGWLTALKMYMGVIKYRF